MRASAITITEALRAYTTLGAYAGAEEPIKGSLETGKLADITVLDRDVFTIVDDDLFWRPSPTSQSSAAR